MDDFGCALFGPILFVTLSYYGTQCLPLNPLYGEDYQVVRIKFKKCGSLCRSTVHSACFLQSQAQMSRVHHFQSKPRCLLNEAFFLANLHALMVTAGFTLILTAKSAHIVLSVVPSTDEQHGSEATSLLRQQYMCEFATFALLCSVLRWSTQLLLCSSGLLFAFSCAVLQSAQSCCILLSAALLCSHLVCFLCTRCLYTNALASADMQNSRSQSEPHCNCNNRNTWLVLSHAGAWLGASWPSRWEQHRCSSGAAGVHQATNFQ